jgi:A/G-specific adenine glycosylase
MLIACHQGRVLLEKRPESGIWGGLWSLPEVAAQTPVKNYCQTFGLIAKRALSLPAFQHTFTHFRLTIEPVLAHVNKPSEAKQHQAQLEWITLEQLSTLGMPTPVRKLIDGLLSDKLLG